MRRTLKHIVILMGVIIAAQGCSSKKEKTEASSEQDKELAAVVGEWKVTREDIDKIIQTLPEDKQAKYNTPAGRAELADALIEEEFYYQEGLKLGLDKDPEVLDAMEKYLRGQVISKYFQDEVQPLARPTDEEMYEYYEEHQDQFTRAPIVRCQHVFSRSRETLMEYKKRIENGEPMTTIAHKYSEDEMTRSDGGDLGYFNPGGYIRGIGYSQEISDAAFSMEVGVVSDPIQWKRGWSIIRVNEKRPAVLRPFEDVKEEIAEMLSARRMEDIKALAFKKLKSKYDYENYLENLTQRTAEELWNLAQNSSDTYHRLRNYEEIVERYPQSEYASQAMFMVGFVYAEELQDYVEADRAFTRVLNEYPGSEVAESARYMLDNMKKPLPKFEGVEGNKR